MTNPLIPNTPENREILRRVRKRQKKYLLNYEKSLIASLRAVTKKESILTWQQDYKTEIERALSETQADLRYIDSLTINSLNAKWLLEEDKQ